MKITIALTMFVMSCVSNPPLDLHPVGGCDGVVTTVEDQGGMHVPVGTSIEWTTNPPATGTHYPMWGGWDRTYPMLERGFYLHNAEHGGIVLLYNCPAGCPDVIASLLDVARGMAADPECVPPLRNRVVVTSDPLLPDGVQVAAVAWNVLYTASCFDPYVATFARKHYRHGPEDICTEGNGAGGTFITP